MKLRGIRRRLSGWKLHRYVERCRYRILCAREKRRKKRPYTQSVLWTTAFRLESGDDEFARIISSPRELLKAGDETVICTRGSVVIWLPEVMDFEKNYEASARVLSIFRRALEAGKRISYIGFENLKEISPACIMAFSSYADIWKRRAPAVHTRCETWSPEVVDAFAQIGVFDMLHVRHGLTDVKNTGRRRYLPLRSCSIQTGEGHDVGTETKRLRKQIEEFTGRSLSRVRMYDSVTEAIFNVRNHAYKGMVPGRLPFRWWFSVSYDEAANELGVILFDHGYGIPATMLRSTKFEKFRSFFSGQEGGWTEASRLYIAFERDRHKIETAQALIEGRGHGCQDIARLVLAEEHNDVKEGSKLSVISGRARYDFTGSDISIRGKSETLPYKLQGTLIEWKIKL